MVIVPKEKPVIENLNSYYLKLDRLCEHFQGEIGSGCVHFRSKDINGLIFFDKDEILNGIIEDRDGETTGLQAAHRLLESAAQNNFTIDLYRIEPEGVYFWASIPTARRIYSGLSTEFTDLKGLIKKMEAEKLTGYIDVAIGDGSEGGILFFNNGVSVGGSYSWSAGETDDTRESQERLIRKVKDLGGTFDVSRIPAAESPGGNGAGTPLDTAQHLIPALEEFLAVFESCVAADRRRHGDFGPLLKRKFVERAEEFPFLDPFAAEFEYADRKISFDGTVDGKTLGAAVLDCCRQLAEELGVRPQLQDKLTAWKDNHGNRLSAMGMTF